MRLFSRLLLVFLILAAASARAENVIVSYEAYLLGADDAPVEGGSYPSGHAAIAVAAAWLAGSYAPRPARLVLLGVAGASAIVRVSQGAHHPVDALGGAALGTAVAAGLRAVLGDDA